MRRKMITIPADLHMEVLKFLPSKTLMRFRCVSKTWNLIVRDPKFAKLHRTISETRPGATTTILCGGRRGNVPRCLYFGKISHRREVIHELTIDTSSEFGLKECGFTDIVNGLVGFCRKEEVLVCNITTHEIISLPTHPLTRIISLPTHPLTRGHCSDLIYCLGFDPVNNEYKILCIKKGLQLYNCTVFTIMKDKEWREVIDPLDFHWRPTFYYDADEFLYHDGAIYWLSPSKKKLVAFDVREEKFRAIGVPTLQGFPKSVLQLVRIGGRMVVCDFVCGSHMFILEDYQNRVWVKSNIQGPSFFYPYGSVENMLIFRGSNHKVFAFDPNNGEIWRFEISGLDYLIEEPKGYKAYKISISEIVENIYPLRQN